MKMKLNKILRSKHEFQNIQNYRFAIFCHFNLGILFNADFALKILNICEFSFETAYITIRWILGFILEKIGNPKNC